MTKSSLFGVALAVFSMSLAGESFARAPFGPKKWAKGFGAGCPSGTVQYIESPDGQTISVLFDKFLVESGKPNGPIAPATQCDLILPFQVPTGQKLKSVQLDYRGFADLPERGQWVTLTSSHKIQNKKGRVKIDQDTNRIMGPSMGEFTFTQRLREGWAAECEESLDFNAKVILRAFSVPQAQAPATASLDSLDAQASLTYRLMYVPCQGPKPPKPPRPRLNRGIKIG